MPIPAPRPTIDAIRPITSASSTTDPMTWPREAPIDRSSASSRVRWATMMENVLRMMKMPTNNAMPHEPEQHVVEELQALVDLVGLLLRQHRTGLDVVAGAELGRDGVPQRVVRRALGRGDGDAGEHVLLAQQQLLRDRLGERHRQLAAQRVTAARVLVDSGDLEGLLGFQREQRDVVADLETTGRREIPAQDDLVVRGRRLALADLLLAGARPVETEPGRARRGDDLAVLADRPRGPLHVTDGRRHARHRLHVGDRLRRQRFRLLALLRLR